MSCWQLISCFLLPGLFESAKIRPSIVHALFTFSLSHTLLSRDTFLTVWSSMIDFCFPASFQRFCITSLRFLYDRNFTMIWQGFFASGFPVRWLCSMSSLVSCTPRSSEDKLMILLSVSSLGVSDIPKKRRQFLLEYCSCLFSWCSWQGYEFFSSSDCRCTSLFFSLSASVSRTSIWLSIFSMSTLIPSKHFEMWIREDILDYTRYQCSIGSPLHSSPFQSHAFSLSSLYQPFPPPSFLSPFPSPFPISFPLFTSCANFCVWWVSHAWSQQ